MAGLPARVDVVRIKVRNVLDEELVREREDRWIGNRGAGRDWVKVGSSFDGFRGILN